MRFEDRKSYAGQVGLAHVKILLSRPDTLLSFSHRCSLLSRYCSESP
jgi:hypothetical protein